MPYININEYDYTITGPKQDSTNIVVVPINANDGPSDRWVTISKYDDFVQTFGSNPNPLSTFGNSWEYAANLLLRGMSVCVKRITHYLSDNGENVSLLPDVSIAKNVIKIKDVVKSEKSNGNSYESGNINVTDIANHSVLKASNPGTEVNNPDYKGSKQSVYLLQTDESIRSIGAFVDVIDTNSEWKFTGEVDNPHYKYQVYGEPTSMDYIHQMEQQTYDDGKKQYKIGDFFITTEPTNAIVKFSPTPIPNSNLIGSQKQYPDMLNDINTDNLTEESFIDVTYDENNENIVNLVWLYDADAETEVVNHKFINGDTSVTGKAYKIFKSNTDLPTKNVGRNYFAGVESTNTIWIYDGLEWGNSGISHTKIGDPYKTTVEGETQINMYAQMITVPFVKTEHAKETNIYRHYFYWENTESAQYIDPDHKEFSFTQKIYFTNTNNPINTTPHKIMEGAEININDIVVNTFADTIKTTVGLNVNNYQDIIIDPDLSDTRLTSGIYGLTNYSLQPLKLYSFKVTQKNDNGSVAVLYDAGLEKIINNYGRITVDPLLRFYDENTKEYLSNPIPKLDNTGYEDKWYIELNPGCTVYYNRNITSGTFNVSLAAFNDATHSNDFNPVIKVFDSSDGSYEISLKDEYNSATDKKAEVIKYFISKVVDEDIDYNDIPLRQNGNFNLFVGEYIYPGTNGNSINVAIKTTINQGIYAYIYRNKQYLERLELCSFRFRDGNTGRIKILDVDLKQVEIWKTILNKFGFNVDQEGNIYDSNMQPVTDDYVGYPITGKYIKLYINPNIKKEKNILSLDFVDSLFAQDGNTKFKLKNGANPSDDHVIHEVAKCYYPLQDKYRFDVTFITNGGYVDKITYPKSITNSLAIDSGMRLIEDAMLDLAKTRKDCVAFLDVPYDLPLEEVPYYFEHISTSYAAAYDPWSYLMLESGTTKWMPPSFVQLYTHAKSIKNGNKMYLPPAGVKRAQVPEIIKTNHDLTSEYINAWQNNDTPQFINPIIWINGYDFSVYGQKTLYNVVNQSDKYQSALQDLNVRLVANEIKKLIFKTCIELTFELNNLMTWNEFKSKIEPKLSVMLGEGVLTDYAILMGTETMTAADLNSGHVQGKVRVAIARAATDWDIDFEITPNGVTFTSANYNSQYMD